jgi:hypothetical protein
MGLWMFQHPHTSRFGERSMPTPSDSSYPENLSDGDQQRAKICSRSNCEFGAIPQPVSNFSKRAANTSDGLSSECKACRRESRNKWRLAHRDYCNVLNKEWQLNNKEYANALRREKRNANREHVNAVQRDWKNNNPEKVKQSYKTFHERHPDYNKDRWSKWKAEHPEWEWSGQSKTPIRYEEHNGWAAKAVGRVKNRAKRNGIPFGMNKEDLLDLITGKLPVFCAIFNHFQLDYYAGPDQRRWASVDRIKPELGYVTGNVRVISMSANMAKLDGIGDIFPVKPTSKHKPPMPDQPSLFDDL